MFGVVRVDDVDVVDPHRLCSQQHVYLLVVPHGVHAFDPEIYVLAIWVEQTEPTSSQYQETESHTTCTCRVAIDLRGSTGSDHTAGIELEA